MSCAFGANPHKLVRVIVLGGPYMGCCKCGADKKGKKDEEKKKK
jgi:hypothetical protein